MSDDNNKTIRPEGGRRIPRPTRVLPCAGCSDPLGRNYPDCPVCRDTIDAYWIADWNVLLAEEGITAGSGEEKVLAHIVIEEERRHPWTVVDWALTFITCPACGGPYAGGDPHCDACQMMRAILWVYDMEAGMIYGTMSKNEHAVRVARWMLRHPAWYTPEMIEGQKFLFPIFLTGSLPTPKQNQALFRRLQKRPLTPQEWWQNSFEEAYARLVVNSNDKLQITAQITTFHHKDTKGIKRNKFSLPLGTLAFRCIPYP